jgi:hypothetical protein
MFNTNVGDMPLDIFADYISDILDEEWCWEYLQFTINANNIGFDIGDSDTSEDGDWEDSSTGNGYGNDCGYGQSGCGYRGFGDGDGTGINLIE